MLTLLESALLARLLPPAELGVYFLAISVVVAFGNLGMFGLGQTAVRLVSVEIARGRELAAARVIERVMAYGLIGAFVAGLGLILGAGTVVFDMLWSSEKFLQLMIPLGILTGLWTLRRVMAEVFRGLGDIRMASLFSRMSVAAVTTLVYFGVWLIAGTSNLRQVVVVLLLSSALSCGVAAAVLARRIRVLDRGEPVKVDPAVIVEAWPIFMNAIVFMVLMNTSLWILGAFGDQDSVAVFGAASRISAAVAIPLPIVNAVLAPLVARLYSAGDIDRLERVLRVCSGVALSVGLAGGVVLLGFGEQILVLIYGPFYAIAAEVLLILTLAQLVSLAAGSSVLTLVQTGNQNALLRVSFWVTVVNLASGLFLVSRFGVRGAALSAGFGLSSHSLACWVAVRVKLGIWAHPTILGWKGVLGNLSTFRVAGR